MSNIQKPKTNKQTNKKTKNDANAQKQENPTHGKENNVNSNTGQWSLIDLTDEDNSSLNYV